MSDHPIKRRLCLVLEDNWLIAEGLKGQLLAQGFAGVKSCKSCTEALDYLSEIAPELPDLALLDVTLENGEISLAVAQALTGTGTPFAIISGHGAANKVSAEFPEAVTLQKPVFDKDLSAMLDSVLGPSADIRQR